MSESSQSTGDVDQEISEVLTELSRRRSLIQSAAQVVIREARAIEGDLQTLVMAVMKRVRDLEEIAVEQAGKDKVG